MRVLMTGGGTGGHVNPAIAIAEIIKMNQPDSEIAFVGTDRGIEKDLVPKAGYKLYTVNIQGIRRSLSPTNIKTAFLVLTSPRRAKKIINDFQPDVVIGTGGYVCWPLLKAASDMGIPSMVHESNAVPGVAVKQLQNKVDVIMTNFESTAEKLDTKKRVVRVGNPLRSAFERIDRTEARRQLGIPDSIKHVILSYGGSMGAHMVNQAVLDLMRDFSAAHNDVLHMHACGKIDREETLKKFREYGLEGKSNLILSEYIYDMPLKMAAADIVICRAGAVTLTEIATMGKPAVLIPSPNVTDNHQYKNAKVLSDAGAAVLIEESELRDGKLEKTVSELLENKAKRAGMSEKVRAFADLNTGKTIYTEIIRLLEQKK